MLSETRVKESETGKGVGTNLVNAFCQEAFGMGAKTVYAGVREEDSEFYKKNGFSETNRWIEMVRK